MSDEWRPSRQGWAGPEVVAPCGCTGLVACCRCHGMESFCFPYHFAAGLWRLYDGAATHRCRKHRLTNDVVLVRPLPHERRMLRRLARQMEREAQKRQLLAAVKQGMNQPQEVPVNAYGAWRNGNDY